MVLITTAAVTATLIRALTTSRGLYQMLLTYYVIEASQ